MPKDDWRKARDHSVAREAAAEYARTGGKSLFPHVGDDNAGPSRDVSAQSKPKKPGSKPSSAKRTNCPHCGCRVLVHNLARHGARCPRRPVQALPGSANAAQPARVTARAMTVCPDCQCRLRVDNVGGHRLRCPKRRKASQPSTRVEEKPGHS
jgi:hypothetical protein